MRCSLTVNSNGLSKGKKRGLSKACAGDSPQIPYTQNLSQKLSNILVVASVCKDYCDRCLGWGRLQNVLSCRCEMTKTHRQTLSLLVLGAVDNQ